MSDVNLLPCPFCGHEAEMQPWHGGGPNKQFVDCSWSEYCPVGPQTTGETPQEAAENWNTRAALANIPDPAAFVAAARGMMEALERIASCEKRTDGDVVDVARTALTTFRAALGEAGQ